MLCHCRRGQFFQVTVVCAESGGSESVLWSSDEGVVGNRKSQHGEDETESSGELTGSRFVDIFLVCR